MIPNILQLLRVKQYIKNGLIFVPLIFSQYSLDGIQNNVAVTTLAFVSFCLISSSVYIFNDLIDIERDKLHRVKAKRPISSGKISKTVAISIACFTLTMSLISAFIAGSYLWLVLLLYLLNNIFYTLYLKQHFLIDIFSITLGFLLRVYAGALVISAPVSEYLLLLVFFLSLFLVAGKRRYELLFLEENSTKHRPSLEGYSVYYLDQLMLISSTVTLVIYSIYSTSSERRALIYTVPIATLGLFRYYSLTHNMNKGEPSDDLLSDNVILIAVLLYLAIIFFGYLR